MTNTKSLKKVDENPRWPGQHRRINSLTARFENSGFALQGIRSADLQVGQRFRNEICSEFPSDRGPFLYSAAAVPPLCAITYAWPRRSKGRSRALHPRLCRSRSRDRFLGYMLCLETRK